MRAFLFCFLLLSSLSIASITEASKKQSGFTIDLIHSDSPLSPFYNPSLTPQERITKAFSSSVAQSKLLRLSRNDQKKFPKTVTISDPYGGYLMRFYIGTPPVERFALADTGSDLIWIQCTPCMKCKPQTTPLFDPTKSTTYRRVRCDSQPCTLFPQNQRRCGKSGDCIYRYGYGDSSFNIGILGVEKISFGNNNNKGGGSGVVFPKFTFGCAYYSEDTDKNKINTGLVGLGSGPLSLISQLGDQIGRKFSYCFLPLDSNYTSKMKFGDEATIKPSKGVAVVSTPLIFKPSSPGFYYLNLEGISIGNKTAKITNKLGQTDGNIFIDSGTTHVKLERRIFDDFVTLVKEQFGVKEAKNPPTPFKFCFKNNETNADYNEIVFHFTGAKVSVDVLQLFIYLTDDDLICTLIDPTDDEDGSIFGNQATVGYQVEYDLEAGKVSFAPADCAK